MAALFGPNGLTPFAQDRTRYPENMFVSCEMVDWLVVNVNDIDDKTAAIAFCQQLLDEKRIMHISGMVSFIIVYIRENFPSPLLPLLLSPPLPYLPV